MIELNVYLLVILVLTTIIGSAITLVMKRKVDDFESENVIVNEHMLKQKARFDNKISKQ